MPHQHLTAPPHATLTPHSADFIAKLRNRTWTEISEIDACGRLGAVESVSSCLKLSILGQRKLYKRMEDHAFIFRSLYHEHLQQWLRFFPPGQAPFRSDASCVHYLESDTTQPPNCLRAHNRLNFLVSQSKIVVVVVVVVVVVSQSKIAHSLLGMPAAT